MHSSKNLMKKPEKLLDRYDKKQFGQSLIRLYLDQKSII